MEGHLVRARGISHVRKVAFAKVSVLSERAFIDH